MAKFTSQYNPKKNGKLIVAKLKGIDDKESAQTFIGKNIEIESQQLADLNDQQFYWRDLVGLNVSNKEGVDFGTLKNMLETGANDVMIVQGRNKGDRERLIPFIIGNTVTEVSLENKTVLVDWHEDD